MPKVTVYLTSYNHEKYLKESIDLSLIHIWGTGDYFFSRAAGLNGQMVAGRWTSETEYGQFYCGDDGKIVKENFVQDGIYYEVDKESGNKLSETKVECFIEDNGRLYYLTADKTYHKGWFCLLYTSRAST